MNNSAKRIDIIAGVPQLLQSALDHSIVGRARKKQLITIETHNLHDYADDTYRHIDDTPYGGGAGMIIQCAPVFACIEQLQQQRTYDAIIFLTPDGTTLTQDIANQFSLMNNIMMLAGHYKGIDQRIRDTLITHEISIGDYVLSGGEIPALVLTDAIVRLIPGAVSDAESVLDDSFMHGLLDAPHYTKPAEFRGMNVPEVLRSGNHALIRQWREQQAIEKTKKRRPDLFALWQQLND
jgi:tRNA (guanine37-N1)-methyltransferase